MLKVFITYASYFFIALRCAALITRENWPKNYGGYGCTEPAICRMQSEHSAIEPVESYGLKILFISIRIYVGSQMSSLTAILTMTIRIHSAFYSTNHQPSLAVVK